MPACIVPGARPQPLRQALTAAALPYTPAMRAAHRTLAGGGWRCMGVTHQCHATGTGPLVPLYYHPLTPAELALCPCGTTLDPNAGAH